MMIYALRPHFAPKAFIAAGLNKQKHLLLVPADCRLVAHSMRIDYCHSHDWKRLERTPNTSKLLLLIHAGKLLIIPSVFNPILMFGAFFIKAEIEDKKAGLRHFMAVPCY